jgi:hypothetical protein
MQSVFTIDELFDACLVLFGPQIQVSLDFLNYLKPEGVKAAYRRQVLTTHPDRAPVTGKNVARMNADFIRATAAYHKLNSVVSGRGIIAPAASPSEASGGNRGARRPYSKPSADRSPTFHNGNLPGRKLPICQFLYYSGLISWDAYISALVWQRRQRPAVGRLARDLGMLSDEEIQSILKRRALQEKFGESAIRLGFLTPYKLMVLLGRQRRFQKQIGDYFVQSGILSRRQVEMMAERQLRHNRRVS